MYTFFAKFDDDVSSAFLRLIVAEVPYGESVRYVLEGLYRTLRPAQRANTCIILRPEVGRQLTRSRIEQLASEGLREGESLEGRYGFLSEIVQDIEKAFRRFRAHPIHVLASEDYGHFLTDNLNPTAASWGDTSDISLVSRLLGIIQDAEIDNLVKVGGCKLPRLGARYYRAPSGRYMRAFLRVGNLQTSRSAIDALYFWLLPHLRNCKGIISDTWSISSITQNASRRLVDYTGTSEPPCPIEMLGDYHDQSEHYGSVAAETIDRFISRVEARGGDPQGQVLILISATHTGSMVEVIRRYLGPRGIAADQVNYVSLFKLSPASNIPTLRDLSEDEDFAVVAEPLQEEKSTAIHIHSTLYFPATPVDIEKRLLLKVIRPYGAFCHRYGDVTFARVHLTDSSSSPSNKRHHAIWIDTEQLIGHPQFAVLFKKKILGLRPLPSVIIHPDHFAARCLAALAHNVLREYGSDASVFPHNDLKLMTDMSDEDVTIKRSVESLDVSRSILFLDDAFITGTRISSYQKNLRDLQFAGPFHYLVAISRPEEERIWKEQRQAFSRPKAIQSTQSDNGAPENQFEYVEQLILPNWEEDRCPWCLEDERMAQIRQAQEGASLSNTIDGIEEDIFVVPRGFSSLSLREGSFFGPPNTSQSNVFCAVAGALQMLRTKVVDNGPLLDDQYFLINPVLNESYYLRYFTDSILMAAIFRAARASELVFANTDREKRRTRAILRYLRTRTTGDLACEVAVAEALGKFPELETIDPSFFAALGNMSAEDVA